MKQSILFLLLLFALSGCLRYRMNDKKTVQYFEKQAHITPTISRHETAEGTIRYLEAGNHAENVLIFIHGAPSSMSIFKEVLTDTALLKQAKVVAVDRPGYGYSNFGKSVTSIKEQARRLAPIITKYAHYKRVILVGASYGGSISAKLAMDYPQIVDDILFVSSSLAPKEEKIYGISHMIKRRAFRWIFPKLIRIANDEKMAHQKALEEILPDWKNIRANIHILHGDADKLIYPSNVAFAQKQLVNAAKVAVKWIPNMGHKISYAHPELIQAALMTLLDELP